MEIGNHKFTPKSLGILAFGALLFLIGVSQLLSSYNEMKYHQHLSQGLIFFHSKHSGQAKYHLSKALQIQEGETGPTALLAQAALSAGRYKEALNYYKQIEEYAFGEDAISGHIGSAVCQIHIYQASKDKKSNTSLYRTLESKIKIISSENPDSTDLHILYAQLLLLQANFFRKNNDHEKALKFLTRAETKFNRAKQTMVDSPPSQMSSISMYAGMAELNYWQAQYILKSNPSPKANSSEAAKIYKKMSQAIDYYRATFLYRNKNRANLTVNLGLVINETLNFPWLTEKQRQSTVLKAQHYQHEIKIFSKHLYAESKSRSQASKEWRLEKSKAYTQNGIAVSNIYAGNYLKADFRLARKMKVQYSSSNDRYARMLRVDKLRRGDDFRVGDAEAFYQSYRKNMILGVLKQKKFSTFDTKKVANFFYITAFSKYKNKAAAIADRMQKLLPKFPDETIIIDNKKLSYKRILKNNMYYVCQGSIHKELAKKLRKYVIK